MKTKSSKSVLGLSKNIFNGKYYITIGKSFDLASGYGWHIQVTQHKPWRDLMVSCGFGYGFHKKSKFSALRIAFKNIILDTT